MPRFSFQPACKALIASVAMAAAIMPAHAQSQEDAAPEAGAVPAAQSSASASSTALVSSVRMVHSHGVPALEITTSRPVVPSIQSVNKPPHLVVDLPDTNLGSVPKRIDFKQEGIIYIHSEQYQQKPPVTRITLDLIAPLESTWDEAGNRLMIRLKPVGQPDAANHPAQPPVAATLTAAPTPAVIPVTGGSGAVVVAGKRLAAGASVTAGAETAVLSLARGGEIHVCPGTSVSVTPSKTRDELMLGMSSGALEMHYTLGSTADTVLTPDFRILFAGPGEFHYAVSADQHGNTCVQALGRNTASATVSELMGDRVYRVKPTEQVVFSSGQIDKVDSSTPVECGCSAPRPVQLLASTGPISPAPESSLGENATLGGASTPSEKPSQQNADKPDSSPPVQLSHGSETNPLPASQPGEVHMQVDTPFVFNARNRTAGPPAALVKEVASLPVEGSSRQMRLETVVEPPAAKRPFLHRLKRFFSGFFG